MNAIIGMSELALHEREPGRINDHLSTIKKAGTNLLTIINDILDFSKIESGKLEIVPADYLVSSLIDDVVNITKVKILDAKFEFKTDIDKLIPKVFIGDEARLRQVMLNVLNNAVKYTAEGFVSLSVKSEPIDSSSAFLTIEVADSGIGIREKDLEKLFRDFSRIDLEKNRAGDCQKPAYHYGRRNQRALNLHEGQHLLRKASADCSGQGEIRGRQKPREKECSGIRAARGEHRFYARRADRPRHNAQVRRVTAGILRRAG
jgi:hypothetical protein